MNILTEYNLSEKVFFLIAEGNQTDVSLFCGEVMGIKIELRNEDEIKILYLLKTHSDYDYIEVEEKNLFRNEESVMKFFRENIRTALSEFEKKEEYDDLPF